MTPNIAVLMFVAFRAVEQEVIANLRTAGFDATLAQARLAARVADGGSRITELAESAQVTKQTASVLVDQLVALGVRRAGARPHGRACPPGAAG